MNRKIVAGHGGTGSGGHEAGMTAQLPISNAAASAAARESILLFLLLPFEIFTAAT
ncbi:hypothetical protein [Paracoccus sp. N5]|uniref:hypothetical protein n=1 Tax=Paracoccus sp. N5 TaxID=1101189 RepID=UPI0003718B35|nr:hypothetical protein [Paracoccus sp. N5]